LTFSLWNPKFFLTAAHNIENFEPHNLMVGGVSAEVNILLLNVEEIIKHPDADLALLKVREEPSPKLQHFQDVVEFQFGTPAGTWGITFQDSEGGMKEPIPRSLTGNLQRLFRHTTKSYSYLAVELSIPFPKGMSGAPVFRIRSPLKDIIGVATGAIDTTSEIDTIETIEKPGYKEVIRTAKVIQYGICVYLEPLLEWLRENIPQGEEQRRQ